jgi:hypothetical protein
MGIEQALDEHGRVVGIRFTPSIPLSRKEQCEKARRAIGELDAYDPPLSFTEIRNIYRQCVTDDSNVFIRCTFG